MLASKDRSFVHEHFSGVYFTRTLLFLDALLQRNCQYNSRTLFRFQHGAAFTHRRRRLTFIWICAVASASGRLCCSSENSEKATKQSGTTQCTQLHRDVSGCGDYHKEECFFESLFNYERDIQLSTLCYRTYRNKDALNVEY